MKDSASRLIRKTHSIKGVDAAFYTVGRIWFPLFLIVLVPAIIAGLLIFHGILPGDDFFRPVMEKLSPKILGVAVLLCVIRYAVNRQAIFIWLFCLALTLLGREFHFRGSGTGVYFVLAFLFYMAWRKYDHLGEYFANGRFVTLLALVFFLYFLSTSLDRSMWRFLPHRRVWSSPLEEAIEAVGHIVLCLTILLAKPSENPLLKRAGSAG
ncbi:MAG: hypothetical protein P1V20_09085 [Verrucomicrobiales bacterium]|nr:hypothetical protein [Verrucomicrobiales bacterium]